MIIKATQSVFVDGPYQGTYDWDGGIPLTIDEVIQVTISGVIYGYKVTNKKVNLAINEPEQLCKIIYTFEQV